MDLKLAKKLILTHFVRVDEDVDSRTESEEQMIQIHDHFAPERRASHLSVSEDVVGFLGMIIIQPQDYMNS